jgi:hypothetical protein
METSTAKIARMIAGYFDRQTPCFIERLKAHFIGQREEP